jgi:cytochrome c peroxidase
MKFRSRVVVPFLRVLAPALLCGVALVALLERDLNRGSARMASAANAPPPPDASWTWNLPPGVPAPVVPADNPMSRVKFELGRRLFYDKQMSGNGVLSCAGCHLQSRAFADNLPRAVGSTGEIHPRSAMTLANIGYASVLTWANPNEKRLEQQALTPMFGEHPVEMGLAGKGSQLLARLRGDSTYRALFTSSFPGRAQPISMETLTKALATFERGLTSFDSPYDRAKFRRSATAMSPAAKRGEQLFFSERTECFHCHGGVILTGSVNYVGKGTPDIEYHNNGLYAIGPNARYPADNPGLAEFTKRPRDNGMFKAPSLRNIGVTAPYMHDGSINSLEEVVAHYARGGRLISSGPNAGDGRRHPNRSPFVRGFVLSAGERGDLVTFLHSLTDSTFLRDPRFADPFAINQAPRR